MKKKNTCQWHIVSSCIFEMCKRTQLSWDAAPAPSKSRAAGVVWEPNRSVSCVHLAELIVSRICSPIKRSEQEEFTPDSCMSLKLAVLQPKGARGVNYPSTALNFPFRSLVPQGYTRREVSITLPPPWIFHLEAWFLKVILGERCQLPFHRLEFSI